MKRIMLSLVLGAVALGAVALTPSKADAQFWWRRGVAYYPGYAYSYPAYYGYAYPTYYPSTYYTYTYPSYNAYTVGNVRYINPGYNTFSYYSPSVYSPVYTYSYTPLGYYYP